MSVRARRLWLTAGLAVSMLPALMAAPSLAQDSTQVDCPARNTCLDYEGVRIEFDPEEGPYQVVIVAEVRTVTTTITDQQTTERSIVAAGFAQDDDGVFAFDREWRLPRDGVFRDAEVGDSLTLGE